VEEKNLALMEILKLLNLETIIIKIKENRLRKKIIGEKKSSEIKKLLDELVKDPRKRVK
jgi:hypothetical protein